ncbi:MAG: type II toxin-antitoxin system Phd/YefM family antitoxin [Nitrospira sp.]
MPKILPTEDIRSLSDFRSNVASFVSQVRQTKRPLVLTQHGRGAAVLLDVGAYEALVEKAELLEDIREAETEIKAGKGIPHTKVKADLLARFKR